jgi:hypothetical protein
MAKMYANQVVSQPGGFEFYLKKYNSKDIAGKNREGIFMVKLVLFDFIPKPVCYVTAPLSIM